jgi:DNA-binding IclR family transcriptional regulator
MTSVNEMKVWDVLREAKRWLPASEIATRAEVHARTATDMAKRLAAIGLVEEARMRPAFHYRAKAVVPREAEPHLAELDLIRDVVRSEKGAANRCHSDAQCHR